MVLLLYCEKVVSGSRPEQHEDLLQVLAPQPTFGFAGGDPPRPPKSFGRVADELVRHVLRREHEIDEPGGDGALGHRRVTGGLLLLRHHHAELALDLLEADRAVAARPRKHDPDRLVLLVLRERTEEVVDGKVNSRRLVPRHRLQRSVQDGQVPPRRNRVDVVGLDEGGLFDLRDRHGRFAPHQLVQEARLPLVEVCDDDEGHAAVRWHVGEELFERRQPAG